MLSQPRALRRAASGFAASIMATMTFVQTSAFSQGPYESRFVPAALVSKSVPPGTGQKETPKPSLPVLTTKTLTDWLSEEGIQYQGLLLAREPWWKDCQEAVDRGVYRGDLGEDEEVTVRAAHGPEGHANLGKVAEELLENLTLPEDVRAAVRQDVCEIGAVISRLCPWSHRLDFKLEFMGENSCTRWHRDNYCARAIVSYNSTGTVYTSDENVDFWELEHGGENEQIIKDSAKCRSLNVGDVLFMKGKKFPTAPCGLVHKSPNIQYHCNGKTVNRLVLKVDIAQPA